jgi:hypothetical protein
MTRRAVSRACGHRGTHADYGRRIVADGDVSLMEFRVCLDCGTWLPLGKSNDAPDEVKVEMRAAELAHDNEHWARLVTKGVPGEDREVDGFLMHYSARAPQSDAELAGYLARCIHDHDRITEHGNDI